MDTIQKDKQEVLNQWNNNPCGQVGDITYDLDYFKKVEDNRYNITNTWMRDFYQYDSKEHQGIKFLEVGYGQGTDLVQYSKSGADCYGIDYTPKHVELAKLNFKLRGLKANLVHGDASKLPFEDNYFDKIVSFGVLHHTPDMDLCIDEINRVLKPGGELVLSLYHKNSAFQYKRMIVDGIFKLKFLTLGYKGLMATVEEGADGKKIKPLVNVYNEKTLSPFLKKFSRVEYHYRHLTRAHMPIIEKFYSNEKIDQLQKKLGWYIIAKAIK